MTRREINDYVHIAIKLNDEACEEIELATALTYEVPMNVKEVVYHREKFFKLLDEFKYYAIILFNEENKSNYAKRAFKQLVNMVNKRIEKCNKIIEKYPGDKVHIGLFDKNAECVVLNNTNGVIIVCDE